MKHPQAQTDTHSPSPFEESLESQIERWLKGEIGRRAKLLLDSRRTAILGSLTSLDPKAQSTEIARIQGQIALIEYLTSPAFKLDLLDH